MMMLKKLAVFDLDGTLNRTDLYSVPAHLKALAERGIHNITPEQIISTFGERASDYVQKLVGNVTDEEARSYLDAVAKYELEFIYNKGKPYDGVLDSLKKLKENGYYTAICSNSSRRYITMVLDALGLMPYIDFIQDLQPNMTKVQTLALLLDKEKPDKAVMVGDRVFDVEAGHKNHLKAIGCLYGFNPDELKDADVKIESAGDIYTAVVQLI